MVTVYVNSKESLDNAIKRFNKMVQKEGITTKVKENMFYTKPSKVKRDKTTKAKRKINKKRQREM